MKAKEKDTVIESLRQEIKNLTSAKLTLERKVQALRDFIGGSDPTANASKRRSYAD
jgi:prefoldin subunit 5